MDNAIRNFSDKLTKYSPIFYLIMIIILGGVATNFFNQEILTEHIIEILILLNLIPLSSFIITKATRRGVKSEASLVCPECNDKMEPLGNWKCSKCGGVFKHGKKEKLQTKK